MSKQQSVSKFFFVDRPCLSLMVPSTSAIETTISGSILVITIAVAALLPSLPYQHINGYRVPKIVFEGRPSTFHAFLLFIMFAFSGAFSALFAHKQPKTARFCRYSSMVSIASAVALLIWSSFSQTS